MKPRSLNEERVLKKIDEMDKYLSELEDMLPSTEEEYTENIVKKRACEKTIELVIECAIDICAMIVSSKKLGVPEDEEGVLTLLEKNHLISRSLKEVLSSMKGFRNILVHKYGIINDELTYEFFSNHLEDFDLFLKEIKKIS